MIKSQETEKEDKTQFHLMSPDGWALMSKASDVNTNLTHKLCLE